MLISLIIVLIIFGAAIYIVTLLPIDATVKRIINVVLIVAVVIYLLAGFVVPVLRSQGIM